MAFVQPRLRLTTAAPFSSAYSSAVSTRDAFDILLSSYTRSTITSTASGVRSGNEPGRGRAVAVDVRDVCRGVGEVIAGGRHAPLSIACVQSAPVSITATVTLLPAGSQQLRLMAQRRKPWCGRPGIAGRLVPEAGQRLLRRERLVEEAV